MSLERGFYVISNQQNSKVLVLGVTGMLGNAVFRWFSQSKDFSVRGSARSSHGLARLPLELTPRVVCGVDVENPDSLTQLFAQLKPDVVINCVGLVKQLDSADDPLLAIPINALLPHRLARLCAVSGARLIHMSTDCVFDGQKGCYTESDVSNSQDLYGRSKFLGEVDYPHAVTLRTSIIGHELGSYHGLVNWFLSQNQGVRGFTRAVFSGLPTVELARVIRDFVIPNPSLRGVYHVSAEPIDKYSLLKLLAEVYSKTIPIEPCDKLVIDRSLDSTRFQQTTGYRPPAWPDLVRQMYRFA